MPPAFLAIGHFCQDVTPNGYTIGGGAAYSTIAARNLGLETYAVEQLMGNGRRSWPDNPFDGLDTKPNGYDATDVDDADSDGEWTYNTTTLKITHQRNDNSRVSWDYDKGTQTGDNADVGTLGSRANL